MPPAEVSVPGPQDPRTRNKLLIETEIDSGVVEVASVPYEIQFSPEHRCNLRCVMCWSTVARNSGVVPLMDRKLPNDTFARFKKLEPWIPLWDWVSLTGSGEPLLSPALGDILQLLKPHHVFVTFNTHGLFIDRTKARMFVETGVDQVTISIDASTKDTYEKIRVNGKWEKLLEAIDALNSAKREMGSDRPQLRLTGNFMRQNLDDLPGLIDFAAAHGATSVLADCTQIYDPSMQQEALIYHPELTRTVVVETIRRARRRNIEFLNWVLVPPEGQTALEVEASALDELERPPAPQGLQRLAANVADSARSARYVARKIFSRELPNVVRRTSARVVRRLRVRRHGPATTPPAPNGGTLLPQPETTGASPPPPDAKTARSAILRACQKPWNGLMVWSDGSVRVCCYSELELGNLNQQPLQEVWNGEMAKALRRSFIEDRPPDGCRNCFIFTRTLKDKDTFLHLATTYDWGLEFPEAGAILQETHTIRGWALHQNGIRSVEVLIDGEIVGEACYGDERPDVAGMFRKYANHLRSGFTYALDAAPLKDGYHLFSLRMTDGDGRSIEAAHRTVRVQHQASALPAPLPSRPHAT